ncbi:MAG TPA: sulfite exporter TauE/SafE family protein [Tissierellales bacterium]|nr:sulfite exporter TauE/SafE family protein [Tissierellales bacterium]
MVTLVLTVLGILTGIFAICYFRDFFGNKDSLSTTGWSKLLGVGFITDFFDTLGIGCFAPTVSLFKFGKMTEDEKIPGTLNVGHTIPVVLEAFLFIAAIEVDPLTLVLLLGAATLGAVIGASIVVKLPVNQIRIAMGIALLVVALSMIAGQVGWMPSGGESLGLTGMKLIIGIVVNFILGALMTIGIGLYAPCMALIYALGMSPRVAFPIMMGSCAFLMPAASIKFVKEGAYDRKASMGLTLGGVVGVLIAYFIVKSLPIKMLTWLVTIVIIYTSVKMLKEVKESGPTETVETE